MQPGDAERERDAEQASTADVPNKETGVGIGAGESSSFEPEEDPESGGEN